MWSIKVSSIGAIIMRQLPRSAGRVVHQPDMRLQVFYSEPCHGKQSQGQEKRFKDHLEKVWNQPKHLGIRGSVMYQLMIDHSKSTRLFETNKLTDVAKKWEMREMRDICSLQSAPPPHADSVGAMPG